MLRLISFFFLFSLSMGAYAQKWMQKGADIDGESGEDQSGYSVSSSSDGNIVAIGAPYNMDGGGIAAGHVRVYKYENNTWTQLGSDIDGIAFNGGDENGRSVSLSDDGTILAVGGPGHESRKGRVRVYQYANNTWTQLGSDIDGESGEDQSGYSVSLSSDGTKVAIGATLNDGNGNNSGHVRVYQYANNIWTKLGQDIDGEASNDRSGNSVSLSSDGTIVAIGAYGNYGGATAAGHVRVYQWDGSTWTQLGGDIDGEAVEDRSGNSVSLSDNGTIVAIGAWTNDGVVGDRNGHVRVYQYLDNSWKQMGSDIDGKNNIDHFGYSVSLSGDGLRFASGAFGGDVEGVSHDVGYVQIYKYVNNSWTKLGDDIIGEATYGNNDQSGYSVSLSNDGKKVAIGAINAYNENGNAETGHVRIYEYRDPNVTISSASLLPEVADETIIVTATLEFASSSDVQVTLASTGTATGGGTDYTLSSNTITIAAGQTTGTATLTAVADQTADDNETIILDISGVTNAIEATEQKVTITISEDICTDSGGSNLSGIISEDRRLYKSCSPYALTGNLRINEGVTLTIDPGVTLQMNNNAYILVQGTLVAEGTSSDSITFNPFGRGIHFDDSAEDYNKTNSTGNRIKYAVIKNPTSGNFDAIINASSRHITTTKEYNSSTGSNNQVSILVSNSYLKDVATNFNGWGGYNVPEETIIEKNIFEGGLFEANNEPNVLVSKNIFKNVRFNTLSAHFEYNVIDSNCNIERIYPQSYGSGTAYDFNNNHIYARIQKFQNGTYLRFFNNTYDITSGDNITGYVQYFTGNNILGGSGYKYKRDINLIFYPSVDDNNLDVNAENNYWGTASLSEVEDKIYDQGDDFNLGKVDVDPILTTPSATAPISKVKNLKITRLANSTELTWDANSESDVAGYKLHYGTLTQGNAPPYTQTYNNVLDLGNVTSKTLTFGLGTTDGITVTAYDSDADGTDDQIEGHESWFAEAEVVSAPVGVNDSYQIAKGGELEVDYVANMPSAVVSFPFDGSLNDVSGTHIGEAVNNSNDQVSFTTNRKNQPNKALQLYSLSYVKIPHNDVFNFKDQGKFSISFWVNKNSSSNEQILLSKDRHSTGWGVDHKDYSSDAELYFRYNGYSTESGILVTPPLSKLKIESDWHHILITYDNVIEKSYIYFDSEKVAGPLIGSPSYHNFKNFSTVNTQPLLIGAYQENPPFSFYGKIDDLRFYNDALSEEAVNLLYNEGAALGILKNDTDLDGDALTATLVQTTTNGTLTLQDNGGFKYVPNAGFSGNDVFTYKATDGTYSSANTTVNISVSTPPTAADDSYSVDEDAVLTVDAAAGILSNDTDAESDAMTAVKLTDPSHGTLILNSDGSFTYDHDGGGSTSDSFTYQASDGIGNSNTATVTITIVASDDAPVANPDAYGTEQDEALSISKEEGVLKNDSDEEGDAMTVELVTDVTLGSLSLSADGSFDYTPPTGQKGIDTFYYKVKAAEQYSNTTYATININGRPVIASNQNFSVDENKPNGYTVGQISIVDESSSFTWEILSGNTNNIFSIDANGYIKVNDNDSLNYERITEVLLSVRAHDGSMWSESKDITININNVNDMAIISYDITPSYCSNSEGTGAITLEIEGEEGNVTVSWSNGANTLSIENLASGTYSVTITDAIGQTINESYEIQLLPIYDQVEVCFITADFNDYTRNRIYVKVGSNPYNIDKYLIYREGVQANVYEKIGEIDPSLAQEAFVDTDVDNRNSSYRYKVRVQDKCGNLSPLSEFQETIHLSSNAGIDGRINLQWTPYRGLEFSTYEIYRSINNEDFDLLTQTSSNSLAYSDVSVDQANQYRYFVAILAEVTCAPSGEAFNGDVDIPTFGIDLNNPTGLKGKKIVRPRGNQEIIEATDDDGDGVINDEDQCPDTPDGETVDSNGCSDSQVDTDEDGVTDDKDQCPNTPTGEVVDANGCSDSQKDTDGDGVTDDKDDCPNTPLGELVFLNGCSVSQLDDDGDGVINGDDQCPNTPSGEVVDANGCSDSQVDTDEDGVTDDKDTCANTPSGETVDANGCSDSQKDTDGDGVTDDKDNCPNTPNGENVDSSGCPAPLFVEKLTFVENVFPNPTDDILTVSLKDNLDINEIYFIDFSGKIIKPKRVDRGFNVLRINVSNLREGIFILNITTDSEVNKAKVFIER